VPEVGSVTFVAPVVVSVRAFAPEVVKAAAVEIFPPSVIVKVPLLTPVPPNAGLAISARSRKFVPSCSASYLVPALMSPMASAVPSALFRVTAPTPLIFRVGVVVVLAEAPEMNLKTCPAAYAVIAGVRVSVKASEVPPAVPPQVNVLSCTCPAAA
jgi:hypothetical protein